MWKLVVTRKHEKEYTDDYKTEVTEEFVFMNEHIEKLIWLVEAIRENSVDGRIEYTFTFEEGEKK